MYSAPQLQLLAVSVWASVCTGIRRKSYECVKMILFPLIAERIQYLFVQLKPRPGTTLPCHLILEVSKKS